MRIMIYAGHALVLPSGVVAGFPVLDIKVALVDGVYHECGSSATTFEIAARAALREGLQKAGSVLLKPIMKVDVTTPEDYLGSVTGDSIRVVARSSAPAAAAMRRPSTRWCRL